MTKNKAKQEREAFLDNLTKDDVLTIIKYGLREMNVPEDVTVEDIYDVIQYGLI